VIHEAGKDRVPEPLVIASTDGVTFALMGANGMPIETK
jgi:hypothetical protein